MRRASGSSPRGRGAFSRLRTDRRGIRVIPARAGSIPVGRAEDGHLAGHPRAGGEQLSWLQWLWLLGGSSPRGRGASAELSKSDLADRVIPARAGSIPRPQTACPWTSGHPRAGGEHVESEGVSVAGMGSSPRGRGACTLLLTCFR